MNYILDFHTFFSISKKYHTKKNKSRISNKHFLNHYNFYFLYIFLHKNESNHQFISKWADLKLFLGRFETFFGPI